MIKWHGTIFPVLMVFFLCIFRGYAASCPKLHTSVQPATIAGEQSGNLSSCGSYRNTWFPFWAEPDDIRSWTKQVSWWPMPVSSVSQVTTTPTSMMSCKRETAYCCFCHKVDVISFAINYLFIFWFLQKFPFVLPSFNKIAFCWYSRSLCSSANIIVTQRKFFI